jgi:hypothetical protein
MKKIFFILFPILGLISCEDSSEGDIGNAMRTEEDNIYSAVSQFDVTSETLATPYFYADNTNFLVGHYTNEKFGDLTGTVLAQVINPSRENFSESYEADSMTLKVYINKHTGTENATFEVYPLKGKLEYRKKYYTNISADEFVDFGEKIGEKDIDARMIENLDTAISKKITYGVSIPIKKEMAESFLADLSVYDSEDSFLDFFKGIYLKTSGSRQAFTVDSLTLCLHYHYPDADTMAIGTLAFPANSEVRQVNKIEANVASAISAKSASEDYIYSPAGIYTQLTIPTKKIVSELIGDNSKDIKYNSVRMRLNKCATDYDDEISAPSHLVMIKRDKLENYFEQKELPDKENSIYASILKDGTTGESYYSFDLTYLLQKRTDQMAYGGEEIEETDTYVLVPVRVTYSKSNVLSLMQNSFTLSALSFTNSQAEQAPLKIITAYSKFYKYKE